MVQKIKWTDRSLDDLKVIYEYIARDSVRYARIQIENIQESVSKLSDFPKMGRVMPEFPNGPYREVITGNYRVIYRYDKDDDTILIIAVVHGRQGIDGLPTDVSHT